MAAKLDTTINNVTNIIKTNTKHLQTLITDTSSPTNENQDYVMDTSLPTNEMKDYSSMTSSMANGETELQRFYNGAGVLITGATGFMGKVLIEKLLRSCPDIGNVYLVVRRKKGKSVQERIDELTNSPCFDRLKTEQPKFKNKLYAITGDLSHPLLGISEEDQQLLNRQVNVVFHVAATVRFDEQIKTAIEQNVTGTREMLALCKTLKLIKSVVHVSTAYANCPVYDIGERFYDPPLDCDEAIQMAENFTHETLNSITSKLLGKWPNTYAFTKAISENVVKKYADSMPVGVFRPGVVVCTSKEPMPGWIDNMYGPTGVIVGVASGVMRTLNVNRYIAANIVPCDMAINALIASAWDIERKWKANHPPPPQTITPPPEPPQTPQPAQDIPFYNYVASDTNRMTWDTYILKYMHYGKGYPASRAIWYFYMVLTISRPTYLLLRFLLHIIPACFMDLAFIISGNKPQMLRIYEKIHKFSDVITYFAMHVWRFEDTHVYNMWDKMAIADKQLFPFDMRALDWDRFIARSCSGLRQYIIDDPPSNLPQAKIRMNRLYWLHRATQAVIIGLFTWCLYLVLNSVLPSIHYLPVDTLRPIKT